MGEATNNDIIRKLIKETEDAKRAVQLLLNCQFNECTTILDEACRSERPCAAAGYCLAQVLRYVTSFEEDHKRKALDAVKRVENDCHNEQGCFRKQLKLLTDKNDIFYQLACYQLDVVWADCQLYQAIVIMMNMDVTSYVKSGWYVRKAWKSYEKLHNEVERLMKCYSVSSASAPTETEGNEKDELNRNQLIYELYCTVSFGFGLFNLFLSILSPQILKLVSFFGFSSCRKTGLDSLALVSQSHIMRAPLAVLTLMWFHTVARPFFALDGTAVNCGAAEAEQLLNKQSDQLANTMLFVFFKGRICRLQSNIVGAISYYEEALKAADNQAELHQMCQYELGWCHLHTLQWFESLQYFKSLKEHSKWLPSYYCYFTGLCYGALGDRENAQSCIAQVSKVIKRKNNPIEVFVSHRAKDLLSVRYELNAQNSVLLLIEMMYLWRALQNVSKPDVAAMLKEINLIAEKQLLPLKCLLEGSLRTVLDETELAQQCLDECIARSDNVKEDKHWTAFARYELAYILMKKKETRPKAKALLIYVRDKQRNYYFENRLNLRVHAAIKMLEKFELLEQ